MKKSFIQRTLMKWVMKSFNWRDWRNLIFLCYLKFEFHFWKINYRRKAFNEVIKKTDNQLSIYMTISCFIDSLIHWHPKHFSRLKIIHTLIIIYTVLITQKISLFRKKSLTYILKIDVIKYLVNIELSAFK